MNSEPMFSPDLQELWSSLDQEAFARFQQAIAEGDLIGGLLALEGATEEEQQRTRAQLDEWSARVRQHPSTQRDPTSGHLALLAVLHDGLGLQGDTEDYYHPRNSALTEVMARRRGLPILISTLWIVVGRGAGLEVDGVGLPGHFIIRVGGPDGLLIDPFNQGREMSRDDCEALIDQLSRGRLPWSDSFLAPVGAHELFERVLRNLVCCHEQRCDMLSLYRCVRFMCGVCEDDPDPHVLHAHLAEAIGAEHLARQAYEAILARFPGTEQAEISQERLETLSQQDRWLN